MAFVKVSQGILRGGTSHTQNGYEYYEFLQVPYAKPPVGELRFKSPQPPDMWSDERDATKSEKNKISSQVHAVAGNTRIVVGSEDCLYLNVYTPQLAAPDLESLPVIVYIHGGGFTVGNGTLKNETGPDYLIEQNNIIVTINYRLGVLGFLSLNIPEAAGNMGLKDQVKALEWVKDNIEHFGGDKNNVTIMGSSAGSASVEYHILSPKSRGLFNKAILQSGSALNTWAINFQPVDIARKLVKMLDYKGALDDTKAIHKFLMTVPESDLALTILKVGRKHGSKRLFCMFVPTVEKDFGNGDAFLISSPYKLLNEGNFSRVPIIRGFCSREGALTSLMNSNAKKSIMETNDFADCYPYDIEPSEKDRYNLNIESAYLGGLKKEDFKLEKIVENFLGDLDFISGIWIAGNILSKYMPMYMYEFEHAGKINGFKRMFGISIDEPGAMHTDDLTYIFKRDAVATFEGDEYDDLVRKRVVTMLTNFVRFGEPVLATSDLIPVNWPQFKEESKVYLGIDRDLLLKSDYEPKKMAIFKELYDNVFGN